MTADLFKLANLVGGRKKKLSKTCSLFLCVLWTVIEGNRGDSFDFNEEL